MKKFVRRLAAGVLAALMICMLPNTVSATCPNGIKGNGTNGIYIDINSAPYTTFANKAYGQYAYNKQGCAWFASARANELTGKGDTIWSGKSWWNSQYNLFGYGKGSEPRAKALACYTGHVAVVEKVDGNIITVSEGGMTGISSSAYGYCVISTMTRSKLESDRSGTGSFLGYVYLNAEDFSPNPFWDVKASDWFYDAAMYVYEHNIMTGLTSAKFGPTDKLYRAQFAVMLHRLEQSPEVPYTGKFADVADNMWYTDAVLWANQNGIINGYGNSGLFGPADYITREQMAVMLYQYAKYKGYDVSASASLDSYSDGVAVSEYAKQAMQWCVGNQIITGKSGGSVLAPHDTATRAECASIFMRFMQKYMN